MKLRDGPGDKFEGRADKDGVQLLFLWIH